MQRTSTRFLGCMWQQSTMQHMLKLHHPQSLKVLNSPRHLASRSSDKTPHKSDAMQTTSKSAPRTPNTIETATKTTTTTTVIPTMMPYRETVMRTITREDNMWKDPQKLDTKWLQPSDPSRYKPDFKQTEPHSLRKQFMRSPDERTRDAMGRDWEAAIQFNENRRRQALMAYQKRNRAKIDNLKKNEERGRRTTKSKLSKNDGKRPKSKPSFDEQDKE